MVPSLASYEVCLVLSLAFERASEHTQRARFHDRTLIVERRRRSQPQLYITKHIFPASAVRELLRARCGLGGDNSSIDSSCTDGGDAVFVVVDESSCITGMISAAAVASATASVAAAAAAEAAAVAAAAATAAAAASVVAAVAASVAAVTVGGGLTEDVVVAA